MDSDWNEAGPGDKDDVQNGSGTPSNRGADPASGDHPMMLEQALQQVEQDRELLGEVVEIFVDTAPDLLNDLRSAAINADAESLRKAAHSLKGAAANICAEPMRATADTLEQMGQGGSLSDVEQQVAQIYKQFEEFKAFMESGLKDCLEGS